MPPELNWQDIPDSAWQDVGSPFPSARAPMGAVGNAGGGPLSFNFLDTINRLGSIVGAPKSVVDSASTYYSRLFSGASHGAALSDPTVPTQDLAEQAVLPNNSDEELQGVLASIFQATPVGQITKATKDALRVSAPKSAGHRVAEYLQAAEQAANSLGTSVATDPVASLGGSAIAKAIKNKAALTALEQLMAGGFTALGAKGTAEGVGGLLAAGDSGNGVTPDVLKSILETGGSAAMTALGARGLRGRGAEPPPPGITPKVENNQLISEPLVPAVDNNFVPPREELTTPNVYPGEARADNLQWVDLNVPAEKDFLQPNTEALQTANQLADQRAAVQAKNAETQTRRAQNFPTAGNKPPSQIAVKDQGAFDTAVQTPPDVPLPEPSRTAHTEPSFTWESDHPDYAKSRAKYGEAVVEVPTSDLLRLAQDDVNRPGRLNQNIGGKGKLDNARNFLANPDTAGVRIPEINVKGGKVVIEDGAHRSIAAEELGVETLPVRIPRANLHKLKELGLSYTDKLTGDVFQGNKNVAGEVGSGNTQVRAGATAPASGERGVAGPEVGATQAGIPGVGEAPQDVVGRASGGVQVRPSTVEPGADRLGLIAPESRRTAAENTAPRPEGFVAPVAHGDFKPPTPPTPPPSEPSIGAPKSSEAPRATVKNYLSKYQRAFKPVIENIRSIPHVGAQLASALESFDHTHATMGGRHFADFAQAIKGLGKSDAERAKVFPQVVEVLEGRADPTTPEIAKAAEGVRAVLDDIKRNAQTHGVFVGEGEANYFPHKFEDGQWSHEKVVQAYADAKGITAEEAAVALNKLRRRGQYYGGKDAALEKARSSEAQTGYRTDPAVVGEYIMSADKRISEAMHLGPNLEKIQPLMDRIGGERDNLHVTTGVMRYLGRERQTDLHAASKAARTLSAVTRLPFAAISQLNSIAQTHSIAGVKALKGLADVVSNYPLEKDAALRSGAIFQNIAGDLGGLTGGTKTKNLYGINSVDQFMRIVANATGKHLVPELVKQAGGGGLEARNTLQRLGVDPTKPLTPEILQNASAKLSELTQYKVDSTSLPGWTTSPLGGLVTQYMKFMYQHTRFVADLSGRAVKGDVLPLARFMASAVLVGEATSDLKAMLKGYGVKGELPDDENSWAGVLRAIFSSKRSSNTSIRLAQNIAFAGGAGLWQTALEKLGTPGVPEKKLDALLGPSYQDAKSVVNVAAGGSNPKPGALGYAEGVGKTAAQEVVGRVPFVGSQIASEFLSDKPAPSKPGWVGRLRDVAAGKSDLKSEVARGLGQGGSANPDRQQLAALEEQQKRNKELKTVVGDTAVKSERTTDEKLGAAKKTELRLQFAKQIKDAYRAGKLYSAKRIAAKAAKLHIHLDLSALKEVVELEKAREAADTAQVN